MSTSTQNTSTSVDQTPAPSTTAGTPPTIKLSGMGEARAQLNNGFAATLHIISLLRDINVETIKSEQSNLNDLLKTMDDRATQEKDALHAQACQSMLVGGEGALSLVGSFAAVKYPEKLAQEQENLKLLKTKLNNPHVPDRIELSKNASKLNGKDSAGVKMTTFSASGGPDEDTVGKLTGYIETGKFQEPELLRELQAKNSPALENAIANIKKSKPTFKDVNDKLDGDLDRIGRDIDHELYKAKAVQQRIDLMQQIAKGASDGTCQMAQAQYTYNKDIDDKEQAKQQSNQKFYDDQRSSLTQSASEFQSQIRQLADAMSQLNRG